MLKITDVERLVGDEQALHVLVQPAVRHLRAFSEPHEAARPEVAFVGVQRAFQHIHAVGAVVRVRRRDAALGIEYLLDGHAGIFVGNQHLLEGGVAGVLAHVLVAGQVDVFGAYGGEFVHGILLWMI